MSGVRRWVFLLLILKAGALGGAPGDVLWSYFTQGIVYGSPAIDDAGNIYVGSEDGDLYCIKPDGTERWIYGDASDWLDSSPALGPDGTVYVGCWDGYLYAINGTTGAKKWVYGTGGAIIGSPAVAPDGTVYFVSYDGGLYAVSPSGELVWSYFSEAEMESSPATDAAGNLYFGNEDGLLISLDASGTLRWTVDLSAYADASLTEFAIQSSPAVSADGLVYVGTRGNLIAAVDANDGSVNWVFFTEDYVDSSPALASDGSIYIGSREGFLYKINSLGVSEWEILVGDIFYAGPAVDAAGNVYIGAYLSDGVSAMVCLASDGSVVWEYPFEGYNDSSPNIAADGTVYFGAHNFQVYAIEGDQGLSTESPWPRYRGNRRQEGRAPADFVFLAPALGFYWEGDILKLMWEGAGRSLYEATDLDGTWTKRTDQAHDQVVESTDRFFFQVK